MPAAGKILIALALAALSTIASCDAPTFFCLESEGGWACYCKADNPEPCGDMGDCLDCPTL